MKKNINLLLAKFFGIALFIFMLSAWKQQDKPASEFYQLTIYHYESDTQEKILDNYLQNALLPALHRKHINSVGVFKPLSNDTASLKMIYVLLPMKSLDMVLKLPADLHKDKLYQAAATAYINTTFSAPAYNRMETILLKAFALAPQLKVPSLTAPKNERVYELRSYESASEKIFKNKVHMFNEGDEIGIFSKLNFNAVFYSEVIAGGKMPNLMYMTCFENMADRNEHWKNFGNHPDWKKLSAMPEYQDNVSHIDVTFLRPVAYSDF